MQLSMVCMWYRIVGNQFKLSSVTKMKLLIKVHKWLLCYDVKCAKIRSKAEIKTK